MLGKLKLKWVAWGLLRNLTQQDYPTSNSNILRTLLISWSVFCLIIAVGYSSNLFSVLSQSHYSTKIKTVEDIVNRKCHWGYNTFPETANMYIQETVSVWTLTYYKLFQEATVNTKILISNSKKTFFSQNSHYNFSNKVWVP